MLALGPASKAALAQQNLQPTTAQPAARPTAPATTTTKAPSTATATPSASAKTRKTTAKHKAAGKQEKPADPIVQAPPPPPPTPEQSPAATPQVTFQDGQLSIRSENSTLGSILSAVKAKTGASLDGPGATASERVATQLGPGDPRDVLTTLLNSTKYDFMLVGAPGSPKSVQKIILTARASGTGAGGGAAASAPRAAQAFQAPTEQPDADQTLPDAEIPDDANQVVEEPPQPEQPEPQQPPDRQEPPQGVPNGIGTQTAPPDGEQQPQGPNQPKSPEQLLQELQRMQQQQQQTQQHPDEPR